MFQFAVLKLTRTPRCAGHTAPRSLQAASGAKFVLRSERLRYHVASLALRAALDTDYEGCLSESSVVETCNEAPLLLRVLRCDPSVPRPPVWFMRQAGRYMSAFRMYSGRYAFRERAETPEIAVELSLQPWRAFGVDAVIMFADILTPLPPMGLDYQIVSGQGPSIKTPVRCMEDVERVRPLTPEDAETALSFVGTTLSTLAHTLADARPRPALLGFLGAPFTLAAYGIEGEGGRASSGKQVKRMMYTAEGRELMHRLLQKITQSMIVFAAYQARKGAEAIQIFDSWAHLLSPEDYQEFSLFYVEELVRGIRAHGVETPLIFFANGSCGKLGVISAMYPADTREANGYRGLDALALDWRTSIAEARQLFGKRAVLQGNIDPTILACGDTASVKAAIDRCVCAASGGAHILNVGHGIQPDTPEEMVALFCEHVRALPETDWYQQLRHRHLVENGVPG